MTIDQLDHNPRELPNKKPEISMVGNVCECRRLGQPYKPAKQEGVIRPYYICLNCGKELSFRDMDFYAWSLQPGPTPPDNNPYHNDRWYS